MDPKETTCGGTYRDGKIVLDRPMKWAEGTRVVVQLLPADAGLIDGVWPADGSPEGEAEIMRRMEEREDDQTSEEAWADMARALEEADRPSREMIEWYRKKSGDKP